MSKKTHQQRGRMAKGKGKRGEREVVASLKRWGFSDAKRTAPLQSHEGGDAADVSGLPGFHVEVKWQETWVIHKWLKQALSDAPQNETPLVVCRRSREPWYVVLEWDRFLEILSENLNKGVE